MMEICLNCNMCCTRENDEELYELIRKYCQINHLDFKKMWNIYSKDPKTKRWLRQVIPSGSLNFRIYCNYLEDDHIYKDYESACAFVHGQDITSKMMPFTFYVSICYRFNMMMLYIFRTTQLFPLNESIEIQITDLKNELFLLLEKYH